MHSSIGSTAQTTTARPAANNPSTLLATSVALAQLVSLGFATIGVRATFTALFDQLLERVRFA